MGQGWLAIHLCFSGGLGLWGVFPQGDGGGSGLRGIPLVKLMQDVRRDADEYVSMGGIYPEGRENGPKALSNELWGVLASGLSMKHVLGWLLVVKCKLVVRSSFVCSHEALWTVILSAAGHETLLRVVSTIHCEDWVDLSNLCICAQHVHSFLAHSHKRLKEQLHAIMEKW
jgi:hypothetical protein